MAISLYFRNVLTRLRDRNDFATQVSVLSLRADVDRRHLSEIELGRNSPGLRLIFKLCDALDVTPSDLMKDVEKRMRAQRAR